MRSGQADGIGGTALDMQDCASSAVGGDMGTISSIKMLVVVLSDTHKTETL
jgi:hypothetical protein